MGHDCFYCLLLSKGNQGQEQQQKRSSGSFLNFSSKSLDFEFFQDCCSSFLFLTIAFSSCSKVQDNRSLISLFTAADDATLLSLAGVKMSPLEFVSKVVESSTAGDTWQFSVSIICRIWRISPKISLEIFST